MPNCFRVFKQVNALLFFYYFLLHQSPRYAEVVVKSHIVGRGFWSRWTYTQAWRCMRCFFANYNGETFFSFPFPWRTLLSCHLSISCMKNFGPEAVYCTKSHFLVSLKRLLHQGYSKICAKLLVAVAYLYVLHLLKLMSFTCRSSGIFTCFLERC